jgi:hypothetical protein
LVFPHADTILAKAQFGFGFGFEPPNFERAAKPPCSAQLRPIAHNPKPKAANYERKPTFWGYRDPRNQLARQNREPSEWLRISILTISA